MPEESADDLRLFASAWSLDYEALSNQGMWPGYVVERGAESRFSGCPQALRIIALGRFGNKFYQLLNAAMIARRLGCGEIRLDAATKLELLPRTIRGIRFLYTDDGRSDWAALRGVFFTYLGFERLLEPLDPWFIQDTIAHLVAPFFQPMQAPLGDHIIAMHFRGGDVFAGAGNGGWVPPLYVMPPASFYTNAVKHARESLGVTEARIVYEDRSNPAIAEVEEYLSWQGIPFQSQSGTLTEDVCALLAAAHLVIPFGTFGEAIALLSGRLRTLYGFRHVGCLGFLYQRERTLIEIVLQQARGVRTFVIDDRRGGYIPPGAWVGTTEQLAMIRDYPESALEIREALPSAP